MAEANNVDPDQTGAVCFLFVWLIRYVPSTIFQLNMNGSSWVEPVLSWDKYVLLKDHNVVTPVRFEIVTHQSRVKHFTSEPLRSLVWFGITLFDQETSKAFS